MGDFDAGHLKSAVAGQDQRAKSGADLRAQRSGDAEAHGGVEALREVNAVVTDFDVNAAEQRIARLRHHQELFLPREKVIDLAEHVRDPHGTMGRGPRRRQVVAVHDLFPVALELGAEQGVHEIAERDVGVSVKAHVDPVLHGPDRPVPKRFGRLAAAHFDIGQEHTQADDQIRLFDARANRRRADRARIDAHEQRMVHRESAFGENRGAAWNAHFLDELDDLSRRLETIGLDAHQPERPLSAAQPFGGIAHRFVELAPFRLRMGQFTVPRNDLLRYRDLTFDHVAVNFEVARLLIQPDGADHLVDVSGRAQRIVDELGGAGDFPVDVQLGLDLPRLMVDQHAELGFFLSRAAADDENRHPLGKRGGNWVDHVVTAGSVGYADGADSAGRTRVTIGGKAHAGFVRKRNDLERPRATELEKQIDDQISRNAEEVENADLLEISDEVIT